MPKPKSKQRRPTRRPTPPSKPHSRQLARREVPTVAEAIEQVLIGGDLMPLSVPQRLEYYRAVCKSLHLNPLTKPFDYIALNGKLVLYARRDCTDQLRKLYGVSVTDSKRQVEGDLCVVEVQVRNKEGRTDTGTGAVPVSSLKGTDLANAIMKAETKAKRRATLSICGLGMMDESELDTVDDYGTLTPGGRIMRTVQPDPEFWCSKHNCDIAKCPSDGHTQAENEQMDALERKRRLTPAQREIVDRKVAESKSSRDTQPAERPGAVPLKGGAAPAPIDITPHLHYELTPSGSYFIDGTESLKKANRDILAPLYVHPTGIMATAAQLGKLISEFERRKVPFRDNTPREPGE